MTRLQIAVLACVLLMSGCVGSPQQPATQASSAGAVSTPPATASDEVLFVGMDLGDALEMLTRRRIGFKIDESEWGSAQEVAVAQLFVIERDDVDDALFLFADSKAGERMRVRDLHWWRNYQTDSRLPKGKRKRQEDHVKSLPIAEVERQFSFELNPWDSDKVDTREGK